MSKNCFIYETLNGVNEMKINKTSDGLMSLSGVFGVCGVRNNNQRVYETSNYSKMVSEMKKRIEEEGGIPGELEHPQAMNITLENVSHKITDINIDANGIVTGSITLLNTPKGKIAQAIVEGGLPLFISSRATGQVDKNNGNVTLERIATYDLVGSPGFSQAKLHLNENQVAESINESNIYYISEKENDTIDMNDTGDMKKDEIIENDNMELQNILEQIELLKNDIEDLKSQNKMLIEQINTVENVEENIKEWVVDEIAPKIQNWIIEEFAPEIEKWCINEYAPEIEKWCINEFAPCIQKWIVEEYSTGVQSWLEESYSEVVQEKIDESLNSKKESNLNAIDETLKILENIEVNKPSYNNRSKNVMLTENLDEPRYIREMPADVRVKYDMASNEVKESIQRRAKIYDFSHQGSIEKFWESVNFDDIKPAKSIYEGLENIIDENERRIRTQLRSWRTKRN